MSNNSYKKKLFIVYQAHEEDLAGRLKELFEHWGFEAFYCREETRNASAAEPYRKVLRDKLNGADLVILLISREFEWSKYCQSEAGVAATLNKAKIIITIPPIGLNDINHISPVLEGYDILLATPKLQVSQLKSAIDKAIETNLNDVAVTDRDLELENNIKLLLQRIANEYRITPSRLLTNVWPKITPECPEAQESIVEHIKRSLSNRYQVTDLALVGVSLKYSLELVTRALEELANKNRRRTGVRNRKKQLRIRLVHMNDHSHILRVINDDADVQNIKKNFGADWTKVKEKWSACAEKASIALDIAEPCGIDYIPPQLGICIDDSTLFSGRCAFEQAGVHNHLLVGELESIHYTDADERGRKAIREFKHALKVYENPNHNAGIALARDPEDWIKHLMDGITDSMPCSEITLISQTATKFSGLISKAFDFGLRVSIHLQDPASDLPTAVRQRIADVPDRLKRAATQANEKRIATGANANGCTFHITYYPERPTYRAALIGNELLGYQTYTPSGELLYPGPLRLIVTKVSSQFESLKTAVMPRTGEANIMSCP